MKALTRGARATILRGGADIVCALDIPVEGAFAVRSLPPGQYTVRDSCGGERHFRVDAGSEHTVILEGSVPGQTGGPGSSGQADSPALHVGVSPAIRDPKQVAPGETITSAIGPTLHTTPDAPGDINVPVGGKLPAQSPTRGVAPEEDERVPGGAGAGHVQDAAERAGVPVPAVVRTTEGAEATRDTTLPAGEGGSSNELTPTFEGPEAGAPLEDGAPERRAQPELGAPAARKAAAPRKSRAKKAK